MTLFVTELSAGAALHELLEGDPAEWLPSPATREKSGNDTDADYGLREYPITLEWTGDQDAAQKWAGFGVGAWSEPTPHIAIEVRAYNDNVLAGCFGLRLDDKVDLTLKGVTDSYWVEKVEEWHGGRNPESGDMNQVPTFRIVLSRQVESNMFWVLGDSKLGKLGETTRLLG